MKKNCCIFFLFLLSQILFSADKKVPVNEIPMYGTKDGNYELTKYDKEFIKELTGKLGGTEKAYKECIKRALEFYNKKDLKMTIVRANQAWLFKRDDNEVYYLFGLATGGKSFEETTEEKINLIREAKSYFIESLKYNEKHAMSYANIGRLCKDLVFAHFLFKIEMKDEEINDFFSKSIKFLDKSLQYAAGDDEFGYIYYQQAITNAMLRDYKKAWDCIYLVKKHKCDYLIEEGFIKQLNQEFPDPGR